jgi:hypothetical protein
MCFLVARISIICDSLYSIADAQSTYETSLFNFFFLKIKRTVFSMQQSFIVTPTVRLSNQLMEDFKQINDLRDVVPVTLLQPIALPPRVLTGRARQYRVQLFR